MRAFGEVVVGLGRDLRGRVWSEGVGCGGGAGWEDFGVEFWCDIIADVDTWFVLKVR